MHRYIVMHTVIQCHELRGVEMMVHRFGCHRHAVVAIVSAAAVLATKMHQ